MVSLRALKKANSAFWFTLRQDRVYPRERPPQERIAIGTVADLPVSRGREQPLKKVPRITISFSELPASEAIVYQLVFHRLDQFDNDYSQCEGLFQYGPVALVDFLSHQQHEDKHVSEYSEYDVEKRKIAYNFTKSPIPNLALIVPIGLGRGDELLECLDSIKRQNLMEVCPERIELLLIQDGDSRDRSLDPFTASCYEILNNFNPETHVRLFKLMRPAQGRSTARNVGIVYASHKIAFFIDSAMILSADFLTEQMLRHARIRGNIALVGFKEKKDLENYWKERKLILSGAMVPDYRKDWKWSHVLREDEAPLEVEGRRYQPNEEIRYMDITDNLKRLRWGCDIGHRSAPTFFHTGIASVPLMSVREVGGFHEAFNPLWGFEDSFLGALLMATQVKLIPCPSSVAFQLSHEEPVNKQDEIIKQRNLFYELLNEHMERFNWDTLKRDIDSLVKKGLVQELSLPTKKADTSSA